MPLAKLDDETEARFRCRGYRTVHVNRHETDFDTTSEYFDSFEIHSAASDAISDAEHHQTLSQSGDFAGDSFTPREDSYSTYPSRSACGEEGSYPGPTFEEPWLPSDAARSLFCKGAPNFEGLILQAAHIPHGHAMCFAMVGIEQEFHSVETPPGAAFSLPTMSLSLYGPVRNPWDALEQPSMTHAFGRLNGTTTLSRQTNVLSPATPLTQIVPHASARYFESDFATDRLMNLQYKGLNPDVSKSFPSDGGNMG